MAETMAQSGQKINHEEYINKMYDSSLASQKQTLQQGYDANVSDLDAQKQKNQRQTDANLTRTYVEAAKAQKNYGEVQNAYGLSSGAMAQARLAQDNQLQADLTALRATQQTADAEVERQRGILAKEYASAIAKAQADNDLQRAQALYEAAKADEDRLLGMQKEAGQLMATKNDYSILAQLYGLTPEQLALLQGEGGGGGDSGGGGSTSYRSPRKNDDLGDLAGKGNGNTLTGKNTPASMNTPAPGQKVLTPQDLIWERNNVTKQTGTKAAKSTTAKRELSPQDLIWYRNS